MRGRRRLAWALSAVALAAGLPSASPAQAPAFAPQATLACLAEAGRAGPEACIGRSAEACMDTPDGGTTVGMGFCLGAERDYWDTRLNNAYRTLLAAEEALDAEMAEIGATVPSTAEALRAMQRAWIPFRDAACDYERATWGGGTGGGPATAACQMRLTGAQALRLEARLRTRSGP